MVRGEEKLYPVKKFLVELKFCRIFPKNIDLLNKITILSLKNSDFNHKYSTANSKILEKLISD